MTFYQRLENLLWYVLMNGNLNPGRTNLTLLHDYAPEFSSWEELASKSLFFIETLNFVLEKPSVTLQNFIQTPGITAREAQPLTPELETVMEEAQHGVVLVSFGSILDNFQDQITTKLLTAFSQPKHAVIWKYNGKIPEHLSVSQNIKIFKWLPQNDLLGHPQTRVFVTHCGNNGQFEAVYHAVPMVGLPLCAEQHHNAFRIQEKGVGVGLIPGGLRNFTTEQLVQAIQEVDRNSKYKTAMLKASAIMRESPMDPVATCTFWLEHILKHGAEHLRSHVVDMPWYQYFMVDVLVVGVVVFPVLIFILFIVIKGIIKCIRGVPKPKVD